MVLIGLNETDMEERFSATTFVAVFTSLVILASQYIEQDAMRVHSTMTLQASTAPTIAHFAIKANSGFSAGN